MHLTRLSNLLNKTSKGHFSKQTTIALKELASQSVGTKNDTLSLQILQSINQIELYTSQLKDVEHTINEIMDNMDSVIKTIPSIGNLNGAMILGEIGDIHRFEKPWQLTLHDETFKSYYDLKMAQARRHYAALGPTAHKLVRVTHKMLTDDVAFNLD